jgi:hypothetical protein
MAPKKPLPPPQAPLPPAGQLGLIIRGLLGGPRGDPDEHHLLAAARVWVLARQLGYTEVANADLERDLRNNSGTDFIDLAERNIIL